MAIGLLAIPGDSFLPGYSSPACPRRETPSRLAVRCAHAKGLRGRTVDLNSAGVGEDPQSDDVLMEQVGRGDHVAYRILLDRHLQRIHAFADRVLHNPSEAEDVAQEVFLRLWKHASRWKPRGPKLSTWLHRIALNLCLNKKQRHRETPSENLPEMPDPENQPGRIADRHEMAQYVNDALLHLPTKQRAALTLCHYQGMRNKEAAEVLGVSIEALESLLARGRRTLKARLSLVATEFFDGNL